MVQFAEGNSDCNLSLNLLHCKMKHHVIRLRVIPNTVYGTEMKPATFIEASWKTNVVNLSGDARCARMRFTDYWSKWEIPNASYSSPVKELLTRRRVASEKSQKFLQLASKRTIHRKSAANEKHETFYTTSLSINYSPENVPNKKS